MNELAIIIPAYNEQRTVKKTLMQYHEFFNNKYDFNIIVVMDGCNDSTYDIVKEMSLQYKEITYINHPKKLGKGGGIIKGFKKAEADFIAFTDADGSTSPRELDKLFCYAKNTDTVIGSRWLHESIVNKKESFARRIASRSFNFMIRILFNLPFLDTQCGAKVFRNYVIEDIIENIKLTNFAFDVEILFNIKNNGYEILEIPIKWNHDDFTELKMAKVIPSMFLSIIGLRIKHSAYWTYIPQWIIKPIHDKIKTI